MISVELEFDLIKDQLTVFAPSREKEKALVTTPKRMNKMTDCRVAQLVLDCEPPAPRLPERQEN